MKVVVVVVWGGWVWWLCGVGVVVVVVWGGCGGGGCVGWVWWWWLCGVGVVVVECRCERDGGGREGEEVNDLVA